MLTTPRRLKPKGEKILRPVLPSAGIEAMYRERLTSLIEEMTDSVMWFVRASYKANRPRIAELAEDETPAGAIQAAIRKLVRRWQKRFDEAAPKLARWFSIAANKRSDAALKKILKDAGIMIEWSLTAAQRDVLNATIAQNVSLIRSIPSTFFSRIEPMVMRSVAKGGDVGGLAKELEAEFGVTKRRAALIAKVQNRQANAVLTRSRQLQVLGSDAEAVWCHSAGGASPRPLHVKAGRDKTRYKVSEGWYDAKEGRNIFPGELINCFPSSSDVQILCGAKKAYRHFYSGYLTEVVTGSGKSFSATPNHPMLTTRGWIAVGALNDGDNLVKVAEDCFDGGTGSFEVVRENNVNDRHSCIGDVFDAISLSGIREIRSRADFHGDVPDSDVDIVFADRPLRFGRQITSKERREQLNLAVAYLAGLGGGSPLKFDLATLDASDGIMSCGGKPPAPVDALVVHSDETRFALVAGNAPDSDDGLPDNISADAVSLGESEDALPGFVFATERVTAVRQIKFEGHVFNLETISGWYMVSGFVAHNCKCFSRPVIKGLA